MNNEKKTEIISSEWQTCVDLVNSTSGRRDSMNNLFVTINLALLAAITYIKEFKTIILLISGMLICVVWFLYINYYKKLNEERYRIIRDLETYLPQQPITEEWNALKKKKMFFNATTLERAFPIGFCILYIGILVSMFCFAQTPQ